MSEHYTILREDDEPRYQAVISMAEHVQTMAEVEQVAAAFRRGLDSFLGSLLLKN